MCSSDQKKQKHVSLQSEGEKKSIFISTPLISTTMSKKSGKRKQREGPMIEGHIDLAMGVTSETIYITKKDGSTVPKKVWVSLDTPNPNIAAIENSPQIPISDEPVDMSSPHPETAHTYQVSIYPK